MKKQLNYSKLLLETVILTVAVAIIAAAVYCSGSLFFSGTKPYFCQQHFRSWNRFVQLCSASAFCDHDDPECGTADHRFFCLR